MAKGWSELLKTLSELKARYLFVIWFPGVFLAFSPNSWLAQLGFLSFVESYRGWIGVIALVFFTLWLVQLGSSFFDKRVEKKLKAQTEKNYQEYKNSVLDKLESLSRMEYFLLAYSVSKGQQVVYEDFTSRHIQSLLQKGLLEAPDMIMIPNSSLQIPDFVWEYLVNNKEKLLPKNAEEQRNFEYMCREYETTPQFLRDRMFD